jgi:Xaa-Pro dipeptidase
VVIDIGCSVDNYASDMTRTFSVTGEYSEAHRHLIETVIEAGDAARAALGPGVTLEQVDSAAREVIEEQGFGRFFVHRVGHPVGLNVHDPGRSPLEPGMVVTIEPGIYIPDGADVDTSYWNLGVRIEDSYIVTEDGWDEITSYPRRPYSD